MTNLVFQKSNYFHQLKVFLLTFLATIIPFSILVIAFKLKTKLPADYLTRDPSAIMSVPFYLGFFSNIGILFWCSCASICLFSYALLRKDIRAKEYSSFFLFSGLLTSLLLLDDFFLIHESVFPDYLHINESIVYASYVALGLLFFIKFKTILKKTELMILLFSLVFFGLSIICDKIFPSISIAVEDTLKLVGITTWFTYFTRICLKRVNKLLSLSVLEKQSLSR
ncbi:MULTISPECIES: hypothetical protein [Nostoc]|uniref:DUF998 domain-containing protein n=2 Tax=Nostoc TaxID=1177 RepID=A0ABR8IEI5_9NOSO|nr:MULTISPECIES: hypothetical protein [Nostoc]MBD2562413.1 hypothetical protein [Nostoc linckia FACHB-391]MBD2648970.1 hypothetical protein [Nostoc foliaceum FACHB-393]